MPLIPASGRQRKEFEAILVYRASSRTARAVTQKNPVSKNKNKNKQKINEPNSRAVTSIKENIDLPKSLFYYTVLFYLDKISCSSG